MDDIDEEGDRGLRLLARLLPNLSLPNKLAALERFVGVVDTTIEGGVASGCSGKGAAISIGGVGGFLCGSWDEGNVPDIGGAEAGGCGGSDGAGGDMTNCGCWLIFVEFDASDRALEFAEDVAGRLLSL